MSRTFRLVVIVLAMVSFSGCGEKSVHQGSLIIQKISASTSTLDYNGKQISAGESRRFVDIDCHVRRPIKDVDIEDFQLVKAKAEIGREENVGSNLEDNAFLWHPIDANGNPVEAIPSNASEFWVRLTYKVPSDASTGYLVNRGEYFGPVVWELTNG